MKSNCQNAQNQNNSNSYEGSQEFYNDLEAIISDCLNILDAYGV